MLRGSRGTVLVVVLALLTPVAAVAGGRWTVAGFPHGNPAADAYSINGLWGTGPYDVWAVGVRSSGDIDDALIAHRKPSGWKDVASGFPGHNITLNGVWGSGADDVWTVGHDFPEGGESSVFAAHYDGSTWSKTQFAESYGEASLSGIWGSSATDVWAVGSHCNPSCDYPNPRTPLILHYDGSAWSQVAAPAGFELTSVWGSATNDVWAVDSDGSIDHYDGSSWAVDMEPPPSGSSSRFSFKSVWGDSATDVWAVGVRTTGNPPKCGGTLTERFDGSQWSIIDSPYRKGCTGGVLTGVWSAGPRAVWAVGYSGGPDRRQTLIEHRKGSHWRIKASPDPGSGANLASIWGDGLGNFWTGGEYLTTSGFTPLLEYRHR